MQPRAMHLLGTYLLLGALVVAVAGVQASNPGTPDTGTARKNKLPGNPAHPPKTASSARPSSIEHKTPAKRPPSPKPSDHSRKPGAPATVSAVASGRTGVPRPRPRQFQPTVGDMLGIYPLPLRPNGPMGYPQFGQGFHNQGPQLPQQFPGFNNPNLSPYHAEQYPCNHLPHNHLHNRPPVPGQDTPVSVEQFPSTSTTPKLFFSKDQMTALTKLPNQLTELMTRFDAISLKLKEWLDSLPIQTQPPIDGRVGDVFGCAQGKPLGVRRGQKPGVAALNGNGVEGTTSKVEAMTTTDGALDEDEAD